MVRSRPGCGFVSVRSSGRSRRHTALRCPGQRSSFSRSTVQGGFTASSARTEQWILMVQAERLTTASFVRRTTSLKVCLDQLEAMELSLPRRSRTSSNLTSSTTSSLDLQIHAHDIAALHVTDFTDAVCVRYFSHIAWIAAIHHKVAIVRGHGVTLLSDGFPPGDTAGVVRRRGTTVRMWSTFFGVVFAQRKAGDSCATSWPD